MPAEPRRALLPAQVLRLSWRLTAALRGRRPVTQYSGIGPMQRTTKRAITEFATDLLSVAVVGIILLIVLAVLVLLFPPLVFLGYVYPFAMILLLLSSLYSHFRP